MATLLPALPGCAPTAPPPSLDPELIQSAIVREVQLHHELGLAIECPAVPVEAGLSFTCAAATRPAGEIELRVTQLDDQGGLRVELLTLIMAEVEEQIRDELGDDLDSRISMVECGDNRPLRAGDTFDCVAEIQADGRDVAVAVVQVDAGGSIEWALASRP